jgi:hypothetical protein
MSKLSNWRAVLVPHKYKDNGSHWAVRADSKDIEGAPMLIELAHWLTEDSARLIAAAPAMLEALKTIHNSLDGQQSAVAATIRAWAHEAIAIATEGEKPITYASGLSPSSEGQP